MTCLFPIFFLLLLWALNRADHQDKIYPFLIDGRVGPHLYVDCFFLRFDNELVFALVSNNRYLLPVFSAQQTDVQLAATALRFS